MARTHTVPRLGGKKAPAATVGFHMALIKAGVPTGNYGWMLQKMRDEGIINGTEYRITPARGKGSATMVSRNVINEYAKYFLQHVKDRQQRYNDLVATLTPVARSVTRMKL